MRCHAPYCGRCQAKPFRKQFFLCRRCQVGMHNRRFVALLLDSWILVYPIYFALAFAVLVLVADQNLAGLIINLLGTGVRGPPLLPRLALPRPRARQADHGPAGRPDERRKDTAHLWPGGRCAASQFIPIFNLVDAIAPYYDPLLRRYGDRWAGTRVLDTPSKLEKDRAKLARRLIKKGVQPAPQVGMTMEDLARIA